MKSGITIIITIWKRGYLDQQLKSLTEQTKLPDSIWIIQHENHIDAKSVIKKYLPRFSKIHLIHSDLNFKYFSRFSICSHVQTDYVLIIDDDVIPASRWLQICLETSRKFNSVVSCTGRLIKPFSFRPEESDEEERRAYFLGDNQSNDEFNFLPEDRQVDYGCNSYFFRTEWIKLFWSLWPATFGSGEDIHLSASLMLSKSIPTIVPQQLSRENSGNLKKLYSQDGLSSWRNPDFLDIRQYVFETLIKEQKWTPLLWRENTEYNEMVAGLVARV